MKGGGINFTVIDSLVKGYIVKKGLSLPTEKVDAILKIDSICKENFDISGYGEGNFDMHIADGTKRLFEMYVDWLLEKEARIALEKKPYIDLDKEIDLFSALNDAVYEVCDSVAYCMAGSGSWAAIATIHYFLLDFERCMYMAIIDNVVTENQGLDVKLSMFDEECALFIKSYKRFEESQPEDAAPIVNKFKNAFHEWYGFRKTVALGIKDSAFKKAYESITYAYARTHLIHLKNRYNSIGMTSDFISNLCLQYDCSNKELLEFNFEKKYEEAR